MGQNFDQSELLVHYLLGNCAEIDHDSAIRIHLTFFNAPFVLLFFNLGFQDASFLLVDSIFFTLSSSVFWHLFSSVLIQLNPVLLVLLEAHQLKKLD